MDRTNFQVPSITCSVCSNKIQNGLKNLEGIKKVDVDLKTKMVNVDYEPDSTNPVEIRQKVTELGYEVI